MNRTLLPAPRERIVRTWIVVLAVMAGAAALGAQASPLWAGLLVAGFGALILLGQPILGLFVLAVIALTPPMEFGTGTEVAINPTTLLVPGLLAIWLLAMVRQRSIHLAPSRTTTPLLLFLLANFLSLLIGSAFWDSFVPRSDNFLLVQLAQWAIFAFSAGAYLLAANLIKNERQLRWLTFAFLLVAGLLAVLSAVVGTRSLVNQVTTVALIRTPFWILLAALAGGQLLFNRKLTLGWRLLLIAALMGAVLYAFVQEQDAVSNWIGVAVVTGVLTWLRFPRLRWPLIALLLALTFLGVLFPSVYEFAGGDDEWRVSGGSRLALTERVIDVTMRNPVTGLGPAAYRNYAGVTPLRYGNALWVDPMVNSHNNYVDLFAHAGIVGLGLFLWFMAEVAWLAWRLRKRFADGFTSGYVNAMVAAWAGIMVVMLLLDWFLPFVYNVGFQGFQASVLVWLFLGGLVALENMPELESLQEAGHAT